MNDVKRPAKLDILKDGMKVKRLLTVEAMLLKVRP